MLGRGDASAASDPSNVGGPRISITSPADGAVIDEPNLLIRGTVSGEGEVGVLIRAKVSGEGEVRVTIFNSLMAMVNGQEFAINVGEIPAGPTAFVLTAMDERGRTASTQITVRHKAPEGDIELRSNTQSGPAPFTTDLKLNAYFRSPIARTTLDLDGSAIGAVTFPYKLEIKAPGIHIAAVTVNTAEGKTYKARYAFSVLDRSAMEKLLLGKWNAMRDALIAGDIDRALTYIAGEKREDRRAMFNDLKEKLPETLRSVQAVNILSLDDGYAEAEAIRMENGEAFSYPVVFGLDWPGVWRVVSF